MDPKTFFKVFLAIVVVLFVTVLAFILLGGGGDEQVSEQEESSVASPKDFPHVDDAEDRESLSVFSEDNEGDDVHSGEDHNQAGDSTLEDISALFGEIERNYSLDDFNRIKAVFRWIVEGEGASRSKTIQGEGFNASGEEEEIGKVESFIRSKGFVRNNLNTQTSGNIEIRGFERGNAVCLLITAPEAKSEGSFDDQRELLNVQIRCGLIND